MDEQLKALLQKLPLIPLLMAYGGYLGWDYYTFSTDPSSPLLTKLAAIHATQAETAQTRDKVKKANEFFQSLQERRSELRGLALQLEEAKATLSEQIDQSAFVKMVNAEANKVGLSVVGIKPTETHEHEYYVEQSFDLRFHGVFVQLVVFLQHLTNLDRIVRIGQFSLKSASPANSQYVELDGNIQLNTYRYRGSQADDLVKNAPPVASPAGSASPSTPSPQASPSLQTVPPPKTGGTT
jgi:Tfp pilus assembly protein PilO